MLLAVMRLSLRHAVEVRMQQLTTSLPSPTSPPLMPIVIQLSSLDVGLIQSAGTWHIHKHAPSCHCQHYLSPPLTPSFTCHVLT